MDKKNRRTELCLLAHYVISITMHSLLDRMRREWSRTRRMCRTGSWEEISVLGCRRQNRKLDGRLQLLSAKPAVYLASHKASRFMAVHYSGHYLRACLFFKLCNPSNSIVL